MMLFSDATFIGIDPTAGQRPFVYAAIDHELRLMALGEGTIDEVSAFLAGQHKAVAAICAPQRPNTGVMAQQEVRRTLDIPLHSQRWTGFRLADYQLRQRNIAIPQTPGAEEACPGWMRMGFRLHRRLENLGYAEYPADIDRLRMEIYPHASFTVLLGVLPFAKQRLEGRIQRQLALFEKKVDVPDPMLFFEEITRHRLMHGILPLDSLYSPAELDALVAAYTAWLAATQPQAVTLVGDASEGQIVLPAVDLKAKYSEEQKRGRT